MTDQTPRTEAGLSLLRRPHRAWPKGHDEWAETLAIIEAQARTEALDRVRDEIDARIKPTEWPDGLADKVLAAILAGETE